MRYEFTVHPSPESKPLPASFHGSGPDGDIGFTTQSMTVNRQPFFGISGELHFSRLNPSDWMDRIEKMKAGGINIVSTYVFWIHHEETPGNFDFAGGKNLRAFLECCRAANVYVILRVGPFAHGEVRNGGLPDWLYGMPFEVRSLNAGFMHYTQRYLNALGAQAAGMMFKDGGPVIGIQLENEYMHSGAIWEHTRATTREYANSSNDGDEYLLHIKALCKQAGLDTPFYTCTAWGGAATPWREALPLWGGYPYAPWLVDAQHPVHPATEEFLYRDCHDPEGARYHSYDPQYDPREMPFACCEMGPGMQVAYHCRFVADPAAADALSNVKIGSGCNFVGYYMYCGGTNPRGQSIPYLNEEWCPKLSYDYQAPIGEFGQLREAWQRLRILHMALNTVGSALIPMMPALPEPLCTQPADTQSLRCAVRSDGYRGFLFLNNFQDHVDMQPLSDMEIIIHTRSGDIGLPPLSIAAGESCMLPFGISVLGSRLLYATVQPIYCQSSEDGLHMYALRPEGMQAVIQFAGMDTFHPAEGETIMIRLADGMLRLTVLSRAQARAFSVAGASICFSEQAILYAREGQICVETSVTELVFTIDGAERSVRFEPYKGVVGVAPACFGRWRITLPELTERADLPDVLLKIKYNGDIAQMFTPCGTLIADHFHNGTVWEVSLRALLERGGGHELTLVIVPRKVGTTVSRDAMAAVSETFEKQIAELMGIECEPVYRARI